MRGLGRKAKRLNKDTLRVRLADLSLLSMTLRAINMLGTVVADDTMDRKKRSPSRMKKS